MTYPEQLVREVLDRILRVPDRFRRLDVDEEVLAPQHHIHPPLLAQLLDLGLPHAAAAGGRRFDANDVENVSLGLGLPSLRRRALQWWAKSLSQTFGNVDATYTVSLTARCPRAGHPEPCAFDLNPKLVAAAVPGSVRPGRPGAWTVDIRLVHTDVYFTDPYTPLIDQVTPLWFHVVPEALNTDLGFVRETGLANCGLATRLTCHLASGMGLAVRSVYGYFLTAPFLTWHTWCEFRAGDRWTPADPFMLTALARWRVPGAEQWPPNRSTGALTWRLYPQNPAAAPANIFHPVTHDGTAAPVSMMSRDRPHA